MEQIDEEVVVVELVAEGLVDRAIARRLGVSVVTVRRRAKRFQSRLGARNRINAVAIAASRGFLRLGAPSGGTLDPPTVDRLIARAHRNASSEDESSSHQGRSAGRRRDPGSGSRGV